MGPNPWDLRPRLANVIAPRFKKIATSKGAALGVPRGTSKADLTAASPALDLYDGSSRTEVASFKGNIDQEDVWHNEIVDLSAYNSSDLQWGMYRIPISSTQRNF